MKNFFKFIINKKKCAQYKDVERYQKEHKKFDMDGGFGTNVGQVDDYFEKSSHPFLNEPYDNHDENHDPKYLDPYYQGPEVDDQIYENKRKEA